MPPAGRARRQLGEGTGEEANGPLAPREPQRTGNHRGAETTCPRTGGPRPRAPGQRGRDHVPQDRRAKSLKSHFEKLSLGKLLSMCHDVYV